MGVFNTPFTQLAHIGEGGAIFSAPRGSQGGSFLSQGCLRRSWGRSLGAFGPHTSADDWGHYTFGHRPQESVSYLFRHLDGPFFHQVPASDELVLVSSLLLPVVPWC